MRQLMAAMTVLVAVMMGPTAWAGEPNSVRVGRFGRLWEAILTRTTPFASAAIDTVYLDVKDLWQGSSGAAATGATEAFIFADNLAAADSISMALAPCATNVSASCIAASGFAVFTMTGAAPVFEKQIGSAACRLYRCIITNNQHASQASIDYRITIQMQASP